MKRVAVLGATGSIGRQSLEVIDRNTRLDLVAASSGTTPIDGLAPLTQVGGDPIELLERAQPDVVLNAIVGFAGVTATLWALEHGVDLALANKESLVAAGDLALAARERGGGRLLPVDSEHSAAFQCLEGRAPETVHALVLTASGGPFRGFSRAWIAEAPGAERDAAGARQFLDAAVVEQMAVGIVEVHRHRAAAHLRRRRTVDPDHRPAVRVTQGEQLLQQPTSQASHAGVDGVDRHPLQVP